LHPARIDKGKCISLNIRRFSFFKSINKTITGDQGSLQTLFSRNPTSYKNILRALLSLKNLQLRKLESFYIYCGNDKSLYKNKNKNVKYVGQSNNVKSQNNYSNTLKFNLMTDDYLFYKKYGIIRIDTGFTKINISFTTLDGKIINWINGGSDSTQTKRTRMSSRSVGNLMDRFLESFQKKIRRKRIRFVKVLFVGPSKRLRSKLFSMVQKKSRSFKFSIICKEEGFRRSFNGCRLSRRKR